VKSTRRRRRRDGDDDNVAEKGERREVVDRVDLDTKVSDHC
jgi:hypothetical protein